MDYSDSHVTLVTGQKCPKIGFGTALAHDDTLRKAIDEALKCGYRSIDTDFKYENEQVIGQVLQDWFSKGKLKREDVFVTTKLPPFGNRREDVLRFLAMSLERLKLDYLDLFLIRHPFGFQCSYDENTFALNPDGDKVIDFETDIEDIWRAMEEQVEAGRVKAIGVSNFNASQLKRITKIAKIPPVANQIELHCYFQQRHLVKKCKELGVAVIAYGPLGAPFTADAKNSSPLLMKNPVVLEIAKHHGKSSAQVLLKFLLQQDIVAIPKSVTPERIKENIDISDFHLSNEEMESLKKLDKGEPGRVFHFREMFPGIEKHKEYPFKTKNSGKLHRHHK